MFLQQKPTLSECAKNGALLVTHNFVFGKVLV
ncbi:MAG: hypothetical protein JWR61_2155 [Ferruginibacter sp.]|nr:hypothetical protein [Ferruginibacter sp.]